MLSVRAYLREMWMPRACWGWLPLVASLLGACLGTRLVNLDNIDVRWPALAPHGTWQADIAHVLAQYEALPVLAPEDDRLDPLFGGLITLSYFGADAQPRVEDQQIPAEGAAMGRSLSGICSAPDVQEQRVRAEVMATTRIPAFVPVWAPLAIAGGAAPEAVRCDDHGRPSGAGAADSFCMFGRLALQPEPGRSLILVVHGMFDSGAQPYVQRLAATLYSLGHSVLLPDMRDHGDTWRAAPRLATTLGTLEGSDLLGLVEAARRSCGAQLGRVGIAGVSGGGLDAIRALTLDRGHGLDAGVLALSPLLDVDATIERLSRDDDTCALTRGIELSWSDDLALGVATGVVTFGGAALVQALHGAALDGRTALAGGIGAGVGLLGASALDAWFDGGSQACVSQNAIGAIVQGALRVRWRTLQGIPAALSAAGQRRAPEASSLAAYVRERAEFRASAQGLHVRHYDPEILARELRAALASAGAEHARLLVLGADDDPLLHGPALHDFVRRIRALPQVYAHVVQHGGHAALSLVQPTATRALLERFFAPGG